MKDKITQFFSSQAGIITTGSFIGIFAALLSLWGNPANMGICVACFVRDITGALGLHQAEAVQYIRPEIPGFVLGSMIAALLFNEFRARSGSAPAVRFVLGLFAMIGALTFLGCPWRAVLRLAGGDFNAVTGIIGLTAGISAGVYFLKTGYNPGRSQKDKLSAGFIMPAFMLVLLIILTADILPVFRSKSGPGSMNAPVIVSLIVSLTVGFLAQRSRFCTMGAVRDVILIKDTHLISGVFALLVSAFAVNIIIGRFNPGINLQPVSHSNHIWNFTGMMLSGLAFTLAGGCPGRQLFLSGEGDGDASVFVFGMIAGAAVSHNFGFAGRPDMMSEGVIITGGTSLQGMIAAVTGIAVCLIIGFTMREKNI